MSRRAVNFSTTNAVITFDLKREEPHVDVMFDLEIGQHPMALRVFLVPKNFTAVKDKFEEAENAGGDSAALAKARAQFQSLSGLGPAGTGTAGVSFYANDAAEQRICDYRHQVRVRGQSDTRPAAPGELNASEPLLTLASIRGKIYMALTSTEPIINQQLVCYLDPPRATVTDDQDHFYSIWRVAATYVVSSTNQAAIIQRLRVKQHLMDDPAALRDGRTGRTPLHVLCENAGDPALAKLLLGTSWKALDPNLRDDKGETALLKLLQRPAVHDVDGPWHNRGCALLELFVRFGGASLSPQSEATGDSLLHLCMRHHSYGGKLLPLLLSLGGGHATIQSMRNNKGVTPEGELSSQHQQEGESSVSLDNSNSSGSSPAKNRFSALQNFMKSGKDQALRLLSSCDKELQQERPKNLSRMRGLPLYRGATDTAPSSLREPPPDLVDFSDDNDRGDGIRRPVIKAKLAKLVFEKYDTQKTGFISRNSLLAAVQSYDLIGLPDSSVDQVLDSLGICSDQKVNLDEFTLVLLKMQSRG